MKYFLCFFFFSVSLFAQEAMVYKDLMASTLNYLRLPNGQSRILRSAYMRQNCRDLTNDQMETYGAEKWIGYPLELCRYRVSDSAGQKLVKEVEVILLKVSNNMYATWMVNTCLAIDQPNLNCVKTLTLRILEQSGGQFLVRGIAYEDMFTYHPDYRKKILGADGYYEPFCFRDGVTVMLEKFRRNSIEILTPEQKANCFAGPLTKDDEKIGQMVRPQGTTMKSYADSEGNTKIFTNFANQIFPNENWLEVSRLETQKAFRTGINNMMIIWAKTNGSKFRKKP